MTLHDEDKSRSMFFLVSKRVNVVLALQDMLLFDVVKSISQHHLLLVTRLIRVQTQIYIVLGLEHYFIENTALNVIY